MPHILCKNVIGLMLGFAIALGTPVNAQSRIPLTLPQTQPTSETDKFTNQLLGQWQSQDPKTKEVLTLIFAHNNQLFLILPTDDGSSIAIKATYQISATKQPMELDMALTSSDIAFTIFEFTPEGKLRVELNGVTPGKPRPQEFSSTTAIFDNISAATTVPENIEVIELESKNNQANRGIPIQYITILNQAQQAYYLEKGKFATNIEELGIGTNLETELYRYQIVPVRDRTDRVTITAQPKEEGLNSYIGAVFAIDNQKIVTGICESEVPAKSLSAMPNPPVSGALVIQCPVGFRMLP
ncbi:type IV pilin-like G/H family protein [Limnofasciculus baicalensis]|uniref:Type IV pilin-like G/H family protein n=1 Tax=Limnofasciculus baicalensis BBK-W-15 TaxID=2699891 RepID=A0AAE3GY36_9CYAN|nr:type IV pilin-like G/H family protein [Limnofasciculus baicalensis]MCP2732222.1 type IV pilin-like G/H family protein [Limnofasciculus baicalensis BBK-W-15]